jgi:RNA polymerase sigma-70 factor (ECF subfamily)
MADGSAPLTLHPGRLAELFAQHGPGLAGAVRAVLGTPDESAEVLQDAFLKASSALRRGASPADPTAWIFVLTLNVARDRRRRRRRRPEARATEDVSDMELRSTEVTPLARLTATEAVDAARAAIARLTDAEKEVFLLRVSGGLTFEAAAAALEIPVGTAKTRMRAALARLRRELTAFAPEGHVPDPTLARRER